MPELPEVQTVVSGLERVLPGREITEVEVFWAKTVAEPGVSEFRNRLKGGKIKNVSRRAKFIVIRLQNESVWLVHLRMSGQLLWRTKNDSHPPSFVRVAVVFSDDSLLLFNDFRKFGKMYWYSSRDEAERKLLGKLGPEPLEISAETFADLFRKKRGKIKAHLLRQEVLAGVGNIYADESLFAAGIHPESETSRIPGKKLQELGKVLQRILREAIRLKGTTSRTYLDINGRGGRFKNFLQVYRRQEKKCPRCSGPIKRIVVAGRGTHLCERCQEKY